jgi:hypothetical protein
MDPHLLKLHLGGGADRIECRPHVPGVQATGELGIQGTQPSGPAPPIGQVGQTLIFQPNRGEPPDS